MQDLNKFKNEMNLSGQNVYVGHRYKPKMFGEWDNTQIYEPLSIVQYQGNSFTSRQYVPVGVELTNEEFWASTGNYNAQVEQYRQDVVKVKSDLNEKASINDLSKRKYQAKNVSEMKSLTNLKIGDLISTSGYLTTNDNGSGDYIVVAANTYSGNEGYHFNLENGLQVALIHNNKVNIHQFGAIGDGIQDDSEAFKTCFKEGIEVTTLNKTYLVKPGVIQLKNKLKWFSNHTIIKVLHDESVSIYWQTALLAQNVDNWHIYGTIEIKGDLNDWYAAHSSETNDEQKAYQHGSGITLKNSDNYYIEHMIIRDCNAFGFYNSVVSQNDNNDVCRNGKIGVLEAYNNRETNILLSAVDGLSIDKIITNDSGRNGLYTNYPKAGLLFEMDFKNCRIWGLEIGEIYSSNNANKGIHSYFGKIFNTPLEQKIEIHIGLHVDKNSYQNFVMNADLLQDNNFKGYVKVDKAIYSSNSNVSPVEFNEWGTWVPATTFDDIQINWNGTDTTSELSFIDYIHGSSGNGGGNFVIKNPNFTCSTNKIKNGFNLNGFAYQLVNIQILNPLKIDAQNMIKVHPVSKYEKCIIIDPFDIIRNDNGTGEISGNHYSLITNKNAKSSGKVTLNLSDNLTCEVIIESNNKLEVEIAGKDYLLPRKSPGAYSLASSDIGARLKLRKVNGETYIESMIGNWEVVV